MANYHVVRRDDQWGALLEGSERVSALKDTQREAEQKAKGFAASSGGGEVRIHGLDGKIRDSDTVAPADDPFPPRDKKH